MVTSRIIRFKFLLFFSMRKFTEKEKTFAKTLELHFTSSCSSQAACSVQMTEGKRPVCYKTRVSTWESPTENFPEGGERADALSGSCQGAHRATSQSMVTAAWESCGVCYMSWAYLEDVCVCSGQTAGRLTITLWGTQKEELGNWINVIFLWKRSNSSWEGCLILIWLSLSHFWQFKKEEKLNVLSIYYVSGNILGTFSRINSFITVLGDRCNSVLYVLQSSLTKLVNRA